MDKVFLDVHSLILSTVAKHREYREHRDGTSGEPLATALNPIDAQILAAAVELADGAGRTVDAVVALPGHAEAVYALLRELLRRRGDMVRLRILCTRDTLDHEMVRELARRGCKAVRIARIPLMTSLIVDGRTTLVCTETAGERQASVLRASSVTQCGQTLFDTVWSHAVDATAWVCLGAHARVELVQQILHYLHTGATDEAASRELSISVRTYRRHIATIMEILDARSRFQAGVRAAELGLLTPRVRPGAEPSRGRTPAGWAAGGGTPPPRGAYSPAALRSIQSVPQLARRHSYEPDAVADPRS
ncbi:LuxR family transcriptional regulator [Streptomyces sp. NPDC088337]|uniref:helix-turn-helix transcriptional regulator n=1 Tax=unclassified Streptomyces TaxID=2593676 RepID=UPI002DD98530|nr:LuxR family transcriptional regulator [Streptomyces sp. NBC_01788]WSB30062.1 LuxR family transcriptional regulator [Streptomyces sp. NBC_01788]